MPQAVLKGFDPAISGLRGISALAVMIYHLSGILPWVLGPLDSWTTCLTSGVPVFLMLSIFLLLNRLDRNPSTRHYFFRRIARIWPIYYAVITSFFLLGYFGPQLLSLTHSGFAANLTELAIPVPNFLRYLTFTEYWVNPAGLGGPSSVFWTLQLEEAVYLFIPLVHRSQRKMEIATGLISVNAAWVAAAWLAGAWVPSGFDYATWAAMRNMAPGWLAAYGFGILAYLGKIPSWPRWTVPPLLLLQSALPIAFPYESIGHTLGLPHESIGYTLGASSVVYLLLLPGFAACVAYPPRFLGRLVLLGESSYSLYALHYGFMEVYSAAGIFLVFPVSFALEFAVRSKEMLRRIGAAYALPPWLKTDNLPKGAPGTPPLIGAPG